MKVLFVDQFLSGHHRSYIEALSQSNNRYESVLVLPERLNSFNGQQYIVPHPLVTMKGYGRVEGFIRQREWMKKIKQIAEKEKPDIVHFLWGDQFYDLFGVGLSLFRKFHTVVTLHWIKEGWKGRIKTRFVSNQCDKVVVHSEYILNVLQSYGIKNGYHIEYPCFNTTIVPKDEGCRMWGLRSDIPVLSIIGSMRKDKGADLLLDALQGIDLPYQLVISRLDHSEIDLDIINEKCSRLSGVVVKHENQLTSKELNCLLAATDIVVLPYRREFNGASGPLGEGVWNYKCIVGSDHGNLGHTITQNHLGYTFICENVGSLRDVLCKALYELPEFRPDGQYQNYREQLDLKAFINKYYVLYFGSKLM